MKAATILSKPRIKIKKTGICHNFDAYGEKIRNLTIIQRVKERREVPEGYFKVHERDNWLV